MGKNMQEVQYKTMLLYILKHFRNAPLYFLLFLPHGLVENIFLVIYHVRVQ